MKSIIIFLILINIIDRYTLLTTFENQSFEENKNIYEKLNEINENIEKLKLKFERVIKVNYYKNRKIIL